MEENQMETKSMTECGKKRTEQAQAEDDGGSRDRSGARPFYFTAEKLSVGYGGKPLIRDIEIRLERGKLLTLIGPNGSGKSTILKSIAGQLKKISGAVYLGGIRPEEMSHTGLAKKMSVMLTERVRPELMTCRDVVSAGRYPHTGRLGLLTERDRKKTEEALAMVGMTAYGDVEFRHVSDGQQQRVLLARAICQEPEFLILDEPTSYLDIRHKLVILEILRDLVRREKVTVILSLHELELAQKISDYVICVKGEYIHRYGTPEEIFRSDYIGELYDLENGYYNDIFGSVEMCGMSRQKEHVQEKNGNEGDETACGEGKPQVFVIAGGGTGAAVFRRLQREEIPFAAGVLHRSDIDFELARVLAACVIAEQPYERIGQAAYEEALDVMKTCRQVICCLRDEDFGEMNEKNRQLLRKAQEAGMETVFLYGELR